VKRAPIPAPGANPALSSLQTLSYGDLLLSQFEPLRAPGDWPKNAASLAAVLRGDGSVLASGASAFHSPAGWAGTTTSAAIQCADAPAQQSSQAWPQVIGHLERVSRLQGRIQGWWEWAPCASWPVVRVPAQVDRGFRRKAITDSGGSRSAIPVDADQRSFA
jgi:hypothetical protein